MPQSSRSTRRRSFAFLTILFSALSVLTLLSSCETPCALPTDTPPTVRVVNAMPDRQSITIWVNNKRFLTDYSYDVASLKVSGYHKTYEDGTGLQPGIQSVRITADTAGKILLDSASIILSQHRQTIYVMGRGVAKPGDVRRTKTMVLDDETRQPVDTVSLVRFVDAIPDLDSIDVYFSGVISRDVNGDPQPDLRIGYGQASNGYVAIHGALGLLVTAARDTSNVILVFPHSIEINGFYATIVIRGQTHPCENEYAVSTLVMNDQPRGTVSFKFDSYSVRLFNAARADSAALWVQQPNDKADIRNNLPSQDLKFFDVGPNSTKGYLSLNPSLASIANFYSWTNGLVGPDIIHGQLFFDSVHLEAKSNQRYTIVNVEETPLGAGSSVKHLLLLGDSLSCGDAQLTPIRFVNVDPDAAGTVSFTIDGKPGSVDFKKSVVILVPPGADKLLTFTGSAVTAKLTVRPGHPQTVFFQPDITGSTHRTNISSTTPHIALED